MKWCECLKREVENCDCSAAPPAPVGGVEGLVKRLRSGEPCSGEGGDVCKDISAKGGCICAISADAIASLSARIAECERERDEARNAGIAIGQSQGFKLRLKLRARVEALEKALMYVRDSGLLSPLGTAFKTVCAALNKGEG
jgi:hypothetical protein